HADSCTGTKLAPGSRCTVDVTFAPRDAGAKTARLAIASSAPGGPDAAPLSGTATGSRPSPGPAAGTTGPPPAAQPDAPRAPAIPTTTTPQGGAKLELDAVTVSSHVTLRAVRRKGITMAAFVAEGARVVKVRLMRNGHVIARIVRRVGASNAVTIELPASLTARRRLTRGAYQLEITPGRRTGDYGVTTT